MFYRLQNNDDGTFVIFKMDGFFYCERITETFHKFLNKKKRTFVKESKKRTDLLKSKRKNIPMNEEHPNWMKFISQELKIATSEANNRFKKWELKEKKK